MHNTGSEADEVTRAQKEAVLRLVAELQSQIEHVITPDLAKRISKVFMVGCGDSYLAARGARLFYDRHVGLPVEPLESMEFSRYVVESMPEDSLVIGISYGGKVSRTIEAIMKARKRGAYTIAATGFAERSAAHEADAAVVGSLPGIRQVVDHLDAALEGQKLSREEVLKELTTPGAAQKLAEALGIRGGLHLALVGMGAFLSSILTLYLIGQRLAVLRGRLSPEEAGRLKAEMLRSMDVQVETIKSNLDKSRQLAEAFKHINHFLFLGSGPSYASAYFSATKLFEQPHLNGVAQYVEEWAHIQFFYTRPGGTPIFVLAPPGESRDRAIEQMRAMKQLGGTVVAICDSDDQELIGLADWAMPISGNVPEEYTPLVYIVPGQLFAFATLLVRGQPPIPAPYSFQKMMEVNYKQVYASTIRAD